MQKDSQTLHAKTVAPSAEQLCPSLCHSMYLEADDSNAESCFDRSGTSRGRTAGLRQHSCVQEACFWGSKNDDFSPSSLNPGTQSQQAPSRLGNSDTQHSYSVQINRFRLISEYFRFSGRSASFLQNTNYMRRK